MKVFGARTCTCFLASLLVACGGGGRGTGGGTVGGPVASSSSSSSVSSSAASTQLLVTPASIDIAAIEGVSSSVTLQIARATGSPGSGYVVVEPTDASAAADVLSTSNVAASGSGPTQSATLNFKELGIGVYTGQIKIAICASYLPCGALPGFPEYVPYKITVTAAAGGSSSSSSSVGAFKITPASLVASAVTGQSVTVPMRVIRAPGTTAEGVVTIVPGADPLVVGTGFYSNAGVQMQSVSFRANTPGTYTGNITVALCQYYSCTGVSPIVQQLVPYTFTVTGAPI